MGSQASYMKMKKSEDFEKLVNILRENGKKSFETATPYEIITLLKPIKGDLFMQCQPNKKYSFKPGEKFVLVEGERSGQRSAYDFFEDCENVPQEIIRNLEIYFVECFPTHEIFDETSGYAEHENFKWKLRKQVKGA